MYHTDDTIAAIASAPGGAERGIVRLSGPAAITIVETCFRPTTNVSLSTVRRSAAVDGSLCLSLVEGRGAACRGVAGLRADGLPAQVYLWPDERSYTRQPVAEIHTLGSPPLLATLLGALCAAGARLAEPGEFTLRAFLAGRIDLTQAEAVLGVIDARGTRDLDRALEQLAGGLARPLNQLRDALLDLLAHLEAGLDFADEDVQFITPPQIDSQLQAAADTVAQATAQLAGRARSDTLPRAALVGWPNVGKSSLFNALAGHGAALVSNDAGTTRDYLTATLDLGSLQCQLVDTAGAEPDSREGIARVAQQLTAAQSESCDIRLLCLDAGRPLNAWERHELKANPTAERLVVLTKCDRPLHAELNAEASADAIQTSAATGHGLQALRQAIRQAVDCACSAESAGLSAQRAGESLRGAAEALARARHLCQTAAGEELVAAEIRLALAELGRVVGAVYTDDILERIFSRFCIGK